MQFKLPEKLGFLFEPYQFKVAYGGRGSGKSWSFARALLIQGYSQQLRVLCTREIQKSIKDSVHPLLNDQIQALGLGQFYQVLETEIRGLNGSQFLFAGLQQHTVESIKSFESVDRCWVEEAQSVSERSWDVLIPTIRRPGSEIWVTLNPQLESDPTYQRFIANPPASAFVRQVNWQENPWMPAELDAERQHAQATMPEAKYAHIWEGRCMPAVEGAIYFDEVAQAEAEGRIRAVPYDPLLKVHAVWDLGWNDSMSIILAQRSSSEIRIIDYIEDSHRKLSDYGLDLQAMKVNWGSDFLPHDGFTADFKTGKTAQEILQGLGRTVPGSAKEPGVPRLDVEQGIKAAREVFPRIYFDKDKTGRLIECLKRYRRNINSKTGEAGAPLHDAFSHGADAFRYLCVVADQMTNNTWGGSIKYPSLGYR